MQKIRFALVLTALFAAQSVFADDMSMSSDSKDCGMIAKACVAAGYKKPNSENKKFWFDCMKPVILGKSVSGVTVDAEKVKACRDSKITELKNELDEMQKAN